jgi:hypothetical protein
MMDPKDFPPRKPSLAIGAKPFDAKDDAGEVKFRAPEGFDTSDMQPGATKEVVCEIAKTEDGMLELKSINGMPVGEKRDETTEAPKDDFMSNAMPVGEGEEA